MEGSWVIVNATDSVRSFAFCTYLTESAALAKVFTERSTQNAYQTAALALRQNQNFLFGGVIDVASICKTTTTELQRGFGANLQDAYFSY